MNALIIFLLLALIVAPVYLAGRKNVWGIHSKRIMAFFMAAILLVGCSPDLSADLDHALEENNHLTESYSELEKKYSNLEEQYDEITLTNKQLEEDISQLTKEKADSLKKLKTIEAANVKLSNEVVELEEENEELQIQLDEMKLAGNTGGGAAGLVASQSVKEPVEKNVTESTADCDIKGSVNGIYHVPGSTYYSRTKNVVQWFCSEQEAKNAGYRAPKR